MIMMKQHSRRLDKIDHRSIALDTGNGINTTTHEVSSTINPYHHNYDGEYTGERNISMENDIRSAQQVAVRASEAAEKVTGVERATSVVQGMDIVVGIDTDYRGNLQDIRTKSKTGNIKE